MCSGEINQIGNNVNVTKKHPPDVIPTPGSVQIYNLFRTLFQLLNNPAEKKFTEKNIFSKNFIYLPLYISS